MELPPYHQSGPINPQNSLHKSNNTQSPIQTNEVQAQTIAVAAQSIGSPSDQTLAALTRLVRPVIPRKRKHREQKSLPPLTQDPNPRAQKRPNSSSGEHITQLAQLSPQPKEEIMEIGEHLHDSIEEEEFSTSEKTSNIGTRCLLNLPPEIWIAHILPYLSWRDQAPLNLVNRQSYFYTQNFQNCVKDRLINSATTCADYLNKMLPQPMTAGSKQNHTEIKCVLQDIRKSIEKYRAQDTSVEIFKKKLNISTQHAWMKEVCKKEKNYKSKPLIKSLQHYRHNLIKSLAKLDTDQLTKLKANSPKFSAPFDNIFEAAEYLKTCPQIIYDDTIAAPWLNNSIREEETTDFNEEEGNIEDGEYLYASVEEEEEVEYGSPLQGSLEEAESGGPLQVFEEETADFSEGNVEGGEYLYASVEEEEEVEYGSRLQGSLEEVESVSTLQISEKEIVREIENFTPQEIYGLTLSQKSVVKIFSKLIEFQLYGPALNLIARLIPTYALDPYLNQILSLFDKHDCEILLTYFNKYWGDCQSLNAIKYCFSRISESLTQFYVPSLLYFFIHEFYCDYVLYKFIDAEIEKGRFQHALNYITPLQQHEKNSQIDNLMILSLPTNQEDTTSTKRKASVADSDNFLHTICIGLYQQNDCFWINAFNKIVNSKVKKAVLSQITPNLQTCFDKAPLSLLNDPLLSNIKNGLQQFIQLNLNIISSENEEDDFDNFQSALKKQSVDQFTSAIATACKITNLEKRESALIIILGYILENYPEYLFQRLEAEIYFDKLSVEEKIPLYKAAVIKSLSCKNFKLACLNQALIPNSSTIFNEISTLIEGEILQEIYEYIKALKQFQFLQNNLQDDQKAKAISTLLQHVNRLIKVLKKVSTSPIQITAEGLLRSCS